MLRILPCGSLHVSTYWEAQTEDESYIEELSRKINEEILIQLYNNVKKDIEENPPKRLPNHQMKACTWITLGVTAVVAWSLFGLLNGSRS